MGGEIRFGVIGAAYMGKAYAIALNSVSTIFELACAREARDDRDDGREGR